MGPDTRVLCEISSDLSAADERKFIEKNKHFWSLKKHYLRIEYSIRVIIGPADIRFELWFDDQKLSRDESITVEWTPAAPPADERFDPAISGRVELPDSPLMSMSGGLETGSVDSKMNGKIERTGTNIVTREKDGYGEDRRKRGMSGLLGKARGGKWSFSVG